MRASLYALLFALSVALGACRPQEVSEAAPGESGAKVGATVGRSVAARVMAAEYGAPESACYWYEDASSGLRYCLRLESRNIHVVDEGRLLYFMAHSDLSKGDFDAADPGILAAFEVRLKDGQVVSRAKAIASGSAGSCQCEEAQFLQMGPAKRFGWLFTSGGTWQGVDAYRYAIVAPVGPEFRDISEIPQVEEERQDMSYAVSIVPTTDGSEFYPLEVRIAENGNETGRITIEYDSVRRSYHLKR